jgi:DNA polymerase alpha subunit p180 N terminal
VANCDAFSLSGKADRTSWLHGAPWIFLPRLGSFVFVYRFCLPSLQFDKEESKRVYEEVDEEDYKRIVADRRKAQDFVVDDEGLGYADDGEEHFADDYDHEDDDDNDADAAGGEGGGSSGRKARLAKAAASKIKSGMVAAYATSGAATTASASDIGGSIRPAVKGLFNC